jgi:hypothetical protein
MIIPHYKRLYFTKNLFVIFAILISTTILGQVGTNDRIDYQKFNKKLFDSLILREVNFRRAEEKLVPFVFDSICFLSANYQVRVMTFQENIKQVHDINLDGVVLNTPQERFDYFNHVNLVLNADRKLFMSECYTGIMVGVESKTFTYDKLVKFILDNFFIGPDIDKIFYGDYGTSNLFAAFSVEVELSERGDVYNIFVTNVVATK